MKLSSAKRGFTLIELLVVIAIIGILSSVVLASLGTARSKARDATRISDLKNIQLALELYYDSAQVYPANTDTVANSVNFPASAAGNVTFKLAPTYIPNIPKDPQDAARVAATRYRYVGSDAANAECIAAAGCASYVLGATLEQTNNPVLLQDQDVAVGTLLYGVGSDCATNSGTEACYSVRP